MSHDVESFLPLAPAPFHLLVALSGGDSHGYALMQKVEALSDGRVKMGPGTMYGTLKRLCSDGLVEESARRPDPGLDDQRRRYYRLTALGRKVCAAEAERLAALSHVARRNLRLGWAT